MELGDGEIAVEVSGAPLPDAPAEMRGFIGVSFHVSPDGSASEDMYLRPSNGRSDDQLRRNHAVQYQSIPGWEWKRLRDEVPGQYEAYVDLQPGVWTPMRVKVSGNRAKLYVNGADQPTLIVRDLKRGAGPAAWRSGRTGQTEGVLPQSRDHFALTRGTGLGDGPRGDAGGKTAHVLDDLRRHVLVEVHDQVADVGVGREHLGVDVGVAGPRRSG